MKQFTTEDGYRLFYSHLISKWVDVFKRTDREFDGDEQTGPLDDKGNPLKGTMVDL